MGRGASAESRGKALSTFPSQPKSQASCHLLLPLNSVAHTVRTLSKVCAGNERDRSSLIFQQHVNGWKFCREEIEKES